MRYTRGMNLALNVAIWVGTLVLVWVLITAIFSLPRLPRFDGSGTMVFLVAAVVASVVAYLAARSLRRQPPA